MKKEPGKKPGRVFLASIKRCGKANNMLHITTCSSTVVYLELNLIAIVMLPHEVSNRNCCSIYAQAEQVIVSATITNL